MADTSHQYELTKQAEQDIEDIFDYTVHEFGIDQAITYVSEFDETFENIAANPELGRQRTEIRKGLRSLVKNSHIIFYHIIKKRVRIIRILHASRDLITFFPTKKD